MDESTLINTEGTKAQGARSLLRQAKKLYLNFFDVNYIYSPLEASQELGLESELVQQLVQEYVTQLLQAVQSISSGTSFCLKITLS